MLRSRTGEEPVIICETKAALRAARADLSGGVGFVPTMGFLHEGHMSLVRAAKAECDRVAVSIFVNPTQFGPNEDLSTYPRDMPRDLAMLEAEGVDLVFTPAPEEIYSGGDVTVDPGRLGRILTGELRPGHFGGVATVVTKLFNLVRPDRAYFGEKDYQQLTLIRAMVADLDMGLEIRGMPTVREADGLAMSSRNVRLTPEHRAAAPILNRALDAAEAAGLRPAAELDRIIRDVLRGRQVEAVDIRDAQTLEEVAGQPTAPVVALLAVRFGTVLLIDQRVIS